MARLIRKLWNAFRQPSARWGAGSLLAIGLIVGVIGWTSFETVVASTNTLEFCTSCHEMRAFVFEEYQQTKHYQNHSGVRAVCSDCHVPRAFLPKMWRKFQATYNELPRHLLGTMDTREEFEARRQAMAEHVWAAMKATDSRECRACHDGDAMALAAQKPRARAQHEDAKTSGETCIDCHKGVAHQLPAQTKDSSDDEAAADDFEL